MVFCMIEESIALGTNWIVFEPDDRWAAQLRKHLHNALGLTPACGSSPWLGGGPFYLPHAEPELR